MSDKCRPVKKSDPLPRRHTTPKISFVNVLEYIYGYVISRISLGKNRTEELRYSEWKMACLSKDEEGYSRFSSRKADSLIRESLEKIFVLVGILVNSKI